MWSTGRTIDIELGELSRAIVKTWAALWPKVRKPEERKDVGATAVAHEPAMLQRHSHIRMAAKRKAVDALTTRPAVEVSDEVGTNVGTTLAPATID